MPEQEVGKVTHYFTHLGVTVLQVTDNIKKGDTLHFKGATTDFTFKLESMQINKKDIEEANPGDDIGMKVPERTREHDVVYKVTE